MNKTMRYWTKALIIIILSVFLGGLAYADSRVFEEPNFKRHDVLKSVLDEKVKDGTVTQDQADKVLENLKRKKEINKIDSARIAAPRADRKAHLKSKLDEKITKGEMTPEQADKILEKGFEKGKRNKCQEKHDRRQNKTRKLQEKLSVMVNENIINQQQADAIVKALQEKLNPSKNKV